MSKRSRHDAAVVQTAWQDQSNPFYTKLADSYYYQTTNKLILLYTLNGVLDWSNIMVTGDHCVVNGAEDQHHAEGQTGPVHAFRSRIDGSREKAYYKSQGQKPEGHDVDG